MPSLRTRTLRAGFTFSVLCALAAQAGDVVPPEVITRVEAALPKDAPPPTQDHVLLEFTVGTDGVPSDILVIESAGAAWDRASTQALSAWRFKPATHEGVPVASRTRLSFNMPVELMARPDAGPPPLEPDAGDVEDAGVTAPAISPTEADAGHPLHEFSTTVLGRGIPRSRGAADFTIEVGALQARAPQERRRLPQAGARHSAHQRRR